MTRSSTPAAFIAVLGAYFVPSYSDTLTTALTVAALHVRRMYVVETLSTKNGEKVREALTTYRVGYADRSSLYDRPRNTCQTMPAIHE